MCVCACVCVCVCVRAWGIHFSFNSSSTFFHTLFQDDLPVVEVDTEAFARAVTQTSYNEHKV